MTDIVDLFKNGTPLLEIKSITGQPMPAIMGTLYRAGALNDVPTKALRPAALYRKQGRDEYIERHNLLPVTKEQSNE